MDFKQKAAKMLLDIKAVSLSPKEPFTWASGIKSPIYCDNRITISYPEVRKEIANGIVEIIRNEFPTLESISGAATGGIPHAAWVADILELPMTYVRSGSKGHGKENQVEGVVKKGQKVVVIEDLISTGGSSLKVVDALIEKGVEVLGVIAIFTYNFDKADLLFKERNMPYFTLTDYNNLTKVAKDIGYISDDELNILAEWRKNPREYYQVK